MQNQQSEEPATKFEERYSELINNINDIIVEVDLNRNFTYISPQVYDILGYKPEELINTNSADLVHPDEKLFDEEDLLKALKDGETLRVERRIKHKHGDYKTFSIRGNIVKTADEIKLVGLFRDISDLRSKERELKESEEKFRMISEQSLVAISITQDGVLKYVNKRMEELSGYSMEEMLDWPPGGFLKLIHPDYKELVAEQSRKKLRGDEDVLNQYEILAVKKNGEEMWAENFSQTINYEGRPAVLSVLIDITDRKTAEQKLKNNEMFLKNVFDAIQDGISILDKDLNIIRVNRWMEKRYFPEGFKIGRKCYTIYQKRDSICPWCPSIKTLDSGFPNTAIVPYPGEENPKGWLEITSFPLWENGMKVTGIIEYVKDITERVTAEQKLKESEEKFKTIAEESNVGIAIVQDNRIKYINNRIAEIFGYRIEDGLEQITDMFFTNVHPDDIEFSKEQTKKVLLDETSKNHYSFKGIHKNGNVIWLDKYDNRITYQGRPAVLSVIVDITEKVKAQELLKKSEEKYREAFNRASLYKDIFAHDINNILQNIRSSSELSSLYHFNPEKISTLIELNEIIKEQVIRGSKLVSNVRKLTEIEDTEIELYPIKIKPVIEEAIDFIKNSIQSKHVDITTEVDNQLHVNKLKVQANNLLIDVFENILFNSVRHNNNERIEIILKLSEEVKDSTTYVRIECIDNGVGIIDSRKDVIFQRGNKQSEGKGMGLGLSLVKKIIDSFHGEIWVEDRVKGDYTKGSNFILLIPEAI